MSEIVFEVSLDFFLDQWSLVGLNTILYIMVKRDSFLLVSSDFHFRSSSRSVTLDLLWYQCLTNLAPLRWTISILLMSTLSCGSQTQLAN